MMQSLKSLDEYDVYVPLKNSRGVAYESDLYKTAKQELIEFFGGLTDTHHSAVGVWQTDDSEISDRIVIWKVLSTKGEDGRLFMRHLKKRLEASLKEEEILIVEKKARVIR